MEDFFKLIEDRDEESKSLIKKAYSLGEKAHKGQERRSGDPYFNHPIEVAKTLIKMGMDTETICAGLLHDTIEDTEIKREEVEKEFGKEILFLVEGVTKLGTVKYRGVERHTESLRKFFIAISEDVRVLIIKLADRLHNVQTLEFVREDKRGRIALETIEIHAPLAGRLGMGKLRGELEDYSFPYAFPKEYLMVENLLAEKLIMSKNQLEKIAGDLKSELETQKVDKSFIDFRIKHKYSLYRKLLRNDMDINKIHDIVALRIIVNTVEDCYRVLGIIHSKWKPLTGRIKDYIALPKPNGYQSLHTTIFTEDGTIAEVQIRTEAMHNDAEYGIAAHSLYKEKGQKHPGRGASWHTAWLEELKEIQKGERSTDEQTKLIENLKMDFFQNRIFIFTPKGDVVDLPEDSSPVDFAYAIHTNIGDSAQGAKVNGKLVSLETKLINGNIVEIITKKGAGPNRKWLSFVKTNLAKKSIRAKVQDGSLLSKFKAFGNIKS